MEGGLQPVVLCSLHFPPLPSLYCIYAAIFPIRLPASHGHLCIPPSSTFWRFVSWSLSRLILFPGLSAQLFFKSDRQERGCCLIFSCSDLPPNLHFWFYTLTLDNPPFLHLPPSFTTVQAPKALSSLFYCLWITWSSCKAHHLKMTEGLRRPYFTNYSLPLAARRCMLSAARSMLSVESWWVLRPFITFFALQVILLHLLLHICSESSTIYLYFSGLCNSLWAISKKWGTRRDASYKYRTLPKRNNERQNDQSTQIDQDPGSYLSHHSFVMCTTTWMTIAKPKKLNIVQHSVLKALELRIARAIATDYRPKTEEQGKADGRPWILTFFFRLWRWGGGGCYH